jgi:hypothetical protein
MSASEEPLPPKLASDKGAREGPRSAFRRPEVVIALAAVALLTALVPYALSFDVYGYTSIDGEYKASHDDDPHRAERSGLIGLGLMLPVVCLGCLVVSLVRRRVAERMALLFSAVLYAFVLGWTCYPYWGYGVHRATRSLVGQSGLDPTGFLPDVWLGGIWQIPAILLRWLALPAVLVLFAVVLRAVLKRRQGGAWICAVAVLLLVLTVLALVSTPLCLLWLLD